MLTDLLLSSKPKLSLRGTLISLEAIFSIGLDFSDKVKLSSRGLTSSVLLISCLIVSDIVFMDCSTVLETSISKLLITGWSTILVVLLTLSSVIPKLPLRGTSISLVSTVSTGLGGSDRVKLPLSGLGSSEISVLFSRLSVLSVIFSEELLLISEAVSE